jgi:hypothetical protein
MTANEIRRTLWIIVTAAGVGVMFILWAAGADVLRTWMGVSK